MYFDSHAHINNEGYTDAQRAELIAAIEASDVSYVVDVGFDLGSSVMAAAHARRHPWCYAAAGFHPHNAKDMDEEAFLLIRGLARKEEVVAVGEIGLDYYRDISPREAQQYWFRRQIALALELGKPIIIHDRDANEDVLRILKEEGVFRRNPVGLLLHCFSGSRDLALQYVKLGAMISIAGPVTYKNARKTAEVAEAVPLDRLLIETDAPYLTPEPFRGRPNASPLVAYTAARVAELRGMRTEALARATLENAVKFFGID
ncbi:MAG: TatD family hydrolase [Clostridiales Family XIII bacterium]|jgi:TatD DNase family protein|nr:TatD family hydrolase [Clostridiales Family XIII bacterium]